MVLKPLSRPVPKRSKYTGLGRGLNQVTPPTVVNPAFLLGGENYEVDTDEPGGFRRFQGYERFDGRAKPSAASYWIIDFDAGTTAMSAGDVVSNTASPTTADPQGELLIDPVITSGDWATNDAAGYLVVTQVSGAATPAGIADNDTLYVGGTSRATADGPSAERAATTDALDDTYLQDAIETLRADIGAVPGSGKIRGVHVYAGAVWAVRDNAGATAAVLHKATTGGWVAQDLGRTLDFTSGSVEIAEGDTITGAISGATATVERIIVTSGDWSTNDAAGRLILSGQTGTFQAENIDDGAFPNVATIAGDSTAITLPVGGRYEWLNYNFGGHSSTERAYGVNGVGTGFEWDGSVFVPIVTGMTTDTPNHIGVHYEHLFMSFPGGSIQNSGKTLPYSWSPRTGAAEFGVGDECTGMLNLPGGGFACFARNNTFVLDGQDNSTWLMRRLSDESGALEWTLQRMGTGVYYDDRGITTLEATDAFGDFQDSTISDLFRPLVSQKKTLILASVRVREKNQYRVFFTDKTGITLTFRRRKLMGAVPFRLEHTVECIASEEISGREELYFGSDDGYVYQLDAGTSMDGQPLIAWLRPVYNHLGTPGLRKRYFNLELEINAEASVSLLFTPDYGYGTTDTPEALQRAIVNQGGGGFWNVATWGNFVWSGAPISRGRARIDGTGTNFGFHLYSESTYEQPHTITGYWLTWSPRRLER